jgi:hypothetical protein
VQFKELQRINSSCLIWTLTNVELASVHMELESLGFLCVQCLSEFCLIYTVGKL